MSEQVKSSPVFISLSKVDGAEVSVTIVPNAIVEKMDERKETIAVSLKAPHLKWPITAYINKKDEEVVAVLRSVSAEARPIRVRIETKRKYNIDKSVAFANLGKTEVVKIVAGVDGLLTSEALTDPSNDPNGGGDFVARPASSGAGVAAQSPQRGGVYSEGKNVMNGVDIRRQALSALKKTATANYLRPEATELMKAIALMFGATVEEVVEAGVADDTSVPFYQGRAEESPAWKLYNSDASLNVGNYGVVSVSRILVNVKKILLSVNKVELPEDRLVRKLAQLVLYTVDVVQKYAYENRRPVNRLANSYTAIVEVVFDVIRFNGGFPVTDSGELLGADRAKDWLRNVGTEAKETYLLAGELFVSPLPSLDVILGLVEEETPAVEGNVPVKEESASTPPVEAVVSVNEAVSDDEPVVVEKPAQKPAKPRDLTPTAVETPMVLDESETDEELYVPDSLLGSGAVSSQNAPDEEDLELFGELLEEEGLSSKANRAKVGKFLEATYGKGYNSPEKIPSNELTNFIDHYVAYSGALKRLVDAL